MDVAERVLFISRDVKRFLVDFDSAVEYQYEAERFLTCAYGWAASEADLNDDGKEVRAYLLANPSEIEN